MLNLDQLEDFEKYCFSKGWTTVPTNGEWEILRMTPKDGGIPLIVHKRKRHDQITFHGESERMAMDYYNRITWQAQKAIPVMEHLPEQSGATEEYTCYYRDKTFSVQAHTDKGAQYKCARENKIKKFWEITAVPGAPDWHGSDDWNPPDL